MSERNGERRARHAAGDGVRSKHGDAGANGRDAAWRGTGTVGGCRLMAGVKRSRHVSGVIRVEHVTPGPSRPREKYSCDRPKARSRRISHGVTTCPIERAALPPLPLGLPHHRHQHNRGRACGLAPARVVSQINLQPNGHARATARYAEGRAEYMCAKC